MWAIDVYGAFWKICAIAPFHGRFFGIKSGKKRRRMDGGAFGEISLHSGSFVTAPAFDPSMMPSGSTSVSAVNSISARAY